MSQKHTRFGENGHKCPTLDIKRRVVQVMWLKCEQQRQFTFLWHGRCFDCAVDAVVAGN